MRNITCRNVFLLTLGFTKSLTVDFYVLAFITWKILWLQLKWQCIDFVEKALGWNVQYQLYPPPLPVKDKWRNFNLQEINPNTFRM